MEFLSIFNSIGTPALILLVLVILFMKIKEIGKDHAQQVERLEEIKRSIAKRLDGFQEEMRSDLLEQQQRQDKRDAKQDEVIEQLAHRLMAVERDYAKKIDIQEAVGGWRTEISKLADRIDLYFIGGKNGRS